MAHEKITTDRYVLHRHTNDDGIVTLVEFHMNDGRVLSEAEYLAEHWQFGLMRDDQLRAMLHGPRRRRLPRARLAIAGFVAGTAAGVAVVVATHVVR